MFTWFSILVFLILVVLRLKAHSQLNWFIVFIPLEIYDTIILTYVLFEMIFHCINGGSNISLVRHIWYVLGMVLKLMSQILLCIKLEYPTWNISTYYVVAPIFLVLTVLCGDIFWMLAKHRPNY